MKRRSVYLDIARGVGMLAIMLGHLPSPTIWRVVFTFHVPIFFLISGYFFKEGTAFGPFLQRKVRTLLVPYYVVCLVLIVFAGIGAQILSSANPLEVMRFWGVASLYGAGSSGAFPSSIGPIGAIWFLWATFWGTLFLWPILKARPSVRPVLVLGVFLAGYLTKDIVWLPLSIQAGAVATLFMYFGHLGKRIKEGVSQLPREHVVASVIFSFVVWFAFIRDFQGFWLNVANVGRGAVDIFGSLCACYALFWICKGIERHLPHLSSGLAYIGQYSILLLSVHLLELNLVPWDALLVSVGITGHHMQLLLTFVGRLVLDIPIACGLSRVNVVRRLYGMRPLASTSRAEGA